MLPRPRPLLGELVPASLVPRRAPVIVNARIASTSRRGFGSTGPCPLAWLFLLAPRKTDDQGHGHGCHCYVRFPLHDPPEPRLIREESMSERTDLVNGWVAVGKLVTWSVGTGDTSGVELKYPKTSNNELAHGGTKRTH